MLVARAVFPIEGLPAMITRSPLCIPPSLSSKSRRPVGTPTIPSSFLKARMAISTVSPRAFSKDIYDLSNLPRSARSKSFFSVPSINCSAVCSKFLLLASVNVFSDNSISFLLK